MAGPPQYKADRADPRYESEAGICANALGTYHMLRAARIAGNFIAIATFTTCVKGLTGGKTFYGFSRDFLCKLFAVNCFELEDPGTVFDLIKVV